MNLPIPDPVPVNFFPMWGWEVKLFVGLWIAAVIIAAGYLVRSVGWLRQATRGNVPGEGYEAKVRVVRAGTALAGLCFFAAIMAIVFVVLS